MQCVQETLRALEQSGQMGALRKKWACSADGESAILWEHLGCRRRTCAQSWNSSFKRPVRGERKILTAPWRTNSSRLRAGETPERIIAGDDRFPVLYHLSEERQPARLVSLRRGCRAARDRRGPGALTGLFAARVKGWWRWNYRRRRADINLARNGRFDNLEIVVGDFAGIDWEERFDYVTPSACSNTPGGSARAARTPTPAFCAACARARRGRLSRPSRNRFGLKLGGRERRPPLACRSPGWKGTRTTWACARSRARSYSPCLPARVLPRRGSISRSPTTNSPARSSPEDAADLARARARRPLRDGGIRAPSLRRGQGAAGPRAAGTPARVRERVPQSSRAEVEGKCGSSMLSIRPSGRGNTASARRSWSGRRAVGAQGARRA